MWPPVLLQGYAWERGTDMRQGPSGACILGRLLGGVGRSVRCVLLGMQSSSCGLPKPNSRHAGGASLTLPFEGTLRGDPTRGPCWRAAAAHSTVHVIGGLSYMYVYTCMLRLCVVVCLASPASSSR